MAPPNREELIQLCEDGIVPEEHWHDRDSEGAQRQLGEAWALLKAGCEFEVLSDRSDEDTWWVTIRSKGFQYFELGEDAGKLEDTRYIPTRARLDKATEVVRRDWY